MVSSTPQGAGFNFLNSLMLKILQKALLTDLRLSRKMDQTTLFIGRMTAQIAAVEPSKSGYYQRPRALDQLYALAG